MHQIDLEKPIERILNTDLDGLHSGGGSSSLRGGQTAANAALAALDISGYAARRSEVLPRERRGATVLSPYIRHNLLTLSDVWSHVHDAPAGDRQKFRDELLWQEYARHTYARLGKRMFTSLRFAQVETGDGDGWGGELACVSAVVDELQRDGWLVNQTRMWLASHWTVRNGLGWRDGQERMYRELIDGSRAANLLGWQWTVGSATGKPYGFARWQVEKRAPGLCASCPLSTACPIEHFPEEQKLAPLEGDPLLQRDPHPERTAGPAQPQSVSKPEVVLLTIESMGDHDPALAAHPDLPVAFVFDEPALINLQLSSKRLVFTLETLRDLAERREVRAYRGDPAEFTRQKETAVTYAPVPSFQRLGDVAELHPYPWLITPHGHSVRSFSAWRQKIVEPS